MAQVENAVRCSAFLDALPWNATCRRVAALKLCEALFQSRRLALSSGNQTIVSALEGMLDIAQKTCPRELEEAFSKFEP